MKNKVNFKNLILSVVALILVMMLTVGVTYSWIEDVKQVQFNTTSDGEDTPLKTGTDINAEVKVDDVNSTIDLGNMLTDSDLKESNGSFKANIDDPTQPTVSAKKGYFYESGDMHLSPCYSDGVDFYFPKEGGGFRKGNKDDENVNYIDFTFKVSSPKANTAFWFDKDGSVPHFSIKDGNNNRIAKACMAITVEGSTKVFTWEPQTVSKNGSSGNTYTTLRPAAYTYGDNYNAYNAKTLFTVGKGTEKNVNVKIWIDGSVGTSISKANIDIKLTSSWAQELTYNLDDQTSGQWAIKAATDKFYVAFPEYYDTYGSWQSGKNYFECTVDTSDHSGTITVPAVYSGEYAYLYRCTSEWDSGDNTLPKSNESYAISANNYWKTNLPASFSNLNKNDNNNTYKYTLYGGAYDGTAAKAIEGNSSNATHLGYGTWNKIEKIILHSSYKYSNSNHDNVCGHTLNESTATNFATYDIGDNKHGHVYLRDFSDERTTKEIYTYEMSWDNSNGYWWTYAPTSSALIQFYYYSEKNDAHKGWWGYRCANEKCLQERPLKKTSPGASGTETGYETEYQITGNREDKKGLCGFWKGHNCVYLLKQGDNFGYASNLYNYFWLSIDGDDKNANWPGYQMTLEAHQTYNNGSYTCDIYRSDAIYSDDAAKYKMYDMVIFNENYAYQTSEMLIYPGCYYHPGEDTWYGNISGVAADLSVTDTTGDTSLSGGITTYPSSNGIYLNIQKGGNYYYKLSDSTGSSAAGSRIKVELGASNDYTVWIIKYDNGGTNYGTGSNDPNDYFDPSSGKNRDFSTGTGSPVRMHVTTAGKYNFSIDSITSTNIRLSFSSAS